MNIFLLDKDANVSARMLYELSLIRFNKQILESTQQIAVAADVLTKPLPVAVSGQVYCVRRYRNHPCTRWTYSSEAALSSHLAYHKSLVDLFRVMRSKTHACEIAVKNIMTTVTSSFIELPPFVGSDTWHDGLVKIVDSDAVWVKYRKYIINKLFLQDGCSEQEIRNRCLICTQYSDDKNGLLL